MVRVRVKMMVRVRVRVHEGEGRVTERGVPPEGEATSYRQSAIKSASMYNGVSSMCAVARCSETTGVLCRSASASRAPAWLASGSVRTSDGLRQCARLQPNQPP